MKRMKTALGLALALALLLHVVPETARAGEVAVDWLWVNSYTKSGGTSRAYINVEPNPKKRVLVGIYENVAGGVGPMMRSAGWMAAIMASQLLGIDLSEYKISYDIFGRVDGPSAGALTTVGVMAAILGDPIKADVSMTGTINPDGTIGPVGGIPQKIQGAVKAGKRTILIPYGSRYGYDIARKRMVDLVDYGESLGAKILQARDIYQAYKALTGKDLPRAQVREDLYPMLPERVFDRTRDAVRAWHSRYNEVQSKYKLIPQQYKVKEIQQTLENAAAIYKASFDALRQGNVGVAYDRAVNAYVTAYSGFVAADVARTLSTLEGDFKEAVRTYIDSHRFSQERANSFYSRLNTERVNSLSDMVTVAAAYAKVVQSLGCILLARTMEQSMLAIEKVLEKTSQKPASRPTLGITVSASPYGRGVVVNAVNPGTLAYRAGILVGDIIYSLNGMPVNSVNDLAAILQQAQVGQTLQFAVLRGPEQRFINVPFISQDYAGQPVMEPQQQARQAQLQEKWFQKMFLAVMLYELSEVSVELAQDRLNIGLGMGEKPVPADGTIKALSTLFSVAADANMKNFESLYVEQLAEKYGTTVSRATMQLMEDDLSFALTWAAYKGFTNYPPKSYVAQLGAAIEIFYATSALISKYYSLGAELDEAGNVIKVRQEQALINMLDLAVRNARQNIILAKEGGSSPIWAQLFYEVGKYSREGNLNDKLTALTSLWHAAALSRVMAFLNGNLQIARLDALKQRIPAEPAAQGTPKPQSPKETEKSEQKEF